MYKILFIILIIFSATPSFAQKEKKVSEIDTLTYNHLINKEYAKEHYRSSLTFNIYEASDGNSYKVGDTLVLGAPLGLGAMESGINKRYAFVIYGGGFNAVFAKEDQHVEAQYEGFEITIKKMIFIKGLGKSMNSVTFVTMPLANRKFSFSKKITVENVDQAITKGEIRPVNSTRPMSSDEAITLLKKKKEELDLGIISQASYDSLRVKLAPIIMKSGN